MTVQRANPFGKLTNEELSDFEFANDSKLPDSYREFLLENNGGIPARQSIKSPDTLVTYLLGMHNGDYYSSLYKHIDVFKNRLPFSCFPIATDPFGNLFIMTLHPESYGQIFFWDQEAEPKAQDGHNISNISFVAYSFEEFLKMLV